MALTLHKVNVGLVTNAVFYVKAKVQLNETWQQEI